MSTLTRDFDVVFPGEIYPRRLRAGDTVEGRVAAMAEAAGAVERPAARHAPERQARTRAPEAKGARK